LARRSGFERATSPFDVEQFRIGTNVELEHGLHDSLTNLSDGDPLVTAKIALAHWTSSPRVPASLANPGFPSDRLNESLCSVGTAPFTRITGSESDAPGDP
jgi:hypothetical protein